MKKSNPEAVVQCQFDAYNQKDLTTLISLYEENAELYQHPDFLLAQGRRELHARFAARFKEPDLHARLVDRKVLGNVVVDHEIVTRNFPEGKGTLELLMIFEVQNECISRAWSIPGAKTIIAN